MRDKWIQVGCFLTGINYRLVKSCSELSVKRVMRYTSALLIVCLLWAFIGYAFTERYLKGSWYYALLAAALMMFVVIHIERQVILASRRDRMLHAFRLVIAFAMALIGTVIIDQIIFKDDINKKKLQTLSEEVNVLFPGRAQEQRNQIAELDSVIHAKENERRLILDDVNRRPLIFSVEIITDRDSLGNETTRVKRSQVPNPSNKLIDPLDRNIANLRTEKAKKDSLLVALRYVVEAEVKQNVGFLDELDVMYSLLSESSLSLIAWLIWFIFLIGLELFILASKLGEEETDYDIMLHQQMNLYFKRINLLGEQSHQSRVS